MLEMISGLVQMTAALIGIEIKEKVVRIKTDRFGYLCLNTRGPSLYISPNGSVYTSTVLIGRSTMEQRLGAVRRRALFGLHPKNLEDLIREGVAWKDYLMFRSDMELQKHTECENCHRALTRFEAYHTNVCMKCLTSELKRLLEVQKELKVAIYPVQEKLEEANKKVRMFRERICFALAHQDPSEIYDDHGTIKQDLLLMDEHEEYEWVSFLRRIGTGGA